MEVDVMVKLLRDMGCSFSNRDSTALPIRRTARGEIDMDVCAGYVASRESDLFVAPEAVSAKFIVSIVESIDSALNELHSQKNSASSKRR
jgi:hypothetical protein